jgi:hypothetical protein
MDIDYVFQGKTNPDCLCIMVEMFINTAGVSEWAGERKKTYGITT